MGKHTGASIEETLAKYFSKTNNFAQVMPTAADLPPIVNEMDFALACLRLFLRETERSAHFERQAEAERAQHVAMLNERAARVDLASVGKCGSPEVAA